MISLIILITSCNFGNSSNENSKKLLGTWSRNFVMNIPSEGEGISKSGGYTITTDYSYIFNENGEGKKIDKTITSWELEKNLNSSYTIEYPFKWTLDKIGDKESIISEFGTGTIINVEGSNKIDQETHINQIMSMTNGKKDTMYLSAINEMKLSYKVPGSEETYEYLKK